MSKLEKNKAVAERTIGKTEWQKQWLEGKGWENRAELKKRDGKKMEHECKVMMRIWEQKNMGTAWEQREDGDIIMAIYERGW